MKTAKTNRVLMVHSIFLIILTIGNTVSSLKGTNSGEGIFSFLFSMPMVEVGLYQAYLLMTIIGIVLWIGAKKTDSWKFDIIGALAHLIPLSALIIFYPILKGTMLTGTLIASLAIHTTWITIEVITAVRIHKKQQVANAIFNH